jgi:hypothetical protein
MSDTLLPIWEVAVDGDWHIVKEWLRRDPSLINVTGAAVRYNGLTLFHLASTLSSDIEVLKYLIARGAKVNAMSEDCVTPLHFAVCNNSAEVVQYLISQGADVHAKDADGFTSLHCAACYGETKPAKILIDSGAELTAKTKSGYTPLHYAAWHGKTEVVEFLIDSGADVHAKDIAGRTPMHLAMKKGHSETAGCLFWQGATTKGFSVYADIVLFAPEGLTVGLRFSATDQECQSDESGLYVAYKGDDWIGRQIRRAASENKIPIVEHNVSDIKVLVDFDEQFDCVPEGIVSVCSRILQDKGLTYDRKKSKFIKIVS